MRRRVPQPVPHRKLNTAGRVRLATFGSTTNGGGCGSVSSGLAARAMLTSLRQLGDASEAVPLVIPFAWVDELLAASEAPQSGGS